LAQFALFSLSAITFSPTQSKDQSAEEAEAMSISSAVYLPSSWVENKSTMLNNTSLHTVQ
jgi:hypothetical protein